MSDWVLTSSIPETPKSEWEVTKQSSELDPNIIKRIPGAVGTAASDIGSLMASLPKSIVQGIMNLPKDIDYLKENVPLAGQLIKNEPISAGRAALAGLGEFGGKISRIPSNVVDYLARIGLIKPETTKGFPRPFSEEEVKSYMDILMGAEKPGQEIIRGGFRNIENIYAGGKAAELLNPLKYTNKSIAKDVIKARDAQKLIHTKAYNDLWEKADKQGFNKVPIDKNKINLSAIKKEANDKYYSALEDFIKDPTLKNAQKAQSDLGKLINSPDFQKAALPSTLQATKDAAISAQNYIKERMFRNANNEINLPLKKRYDLITQSYEKNVIPYTTNKAINEFRRGELLPKELIPKLEKGKFAAKKGSAHPEIQRRESAKSLLKYGAGTELLAHILGIDKTILDKLMGKE